MRFFAPSFVLTIRGTFSHVNPNHLPPDQPVYMIEAQVDPQVIGNDGLPVGNPPLLRQRGRYAVLLIPPLHTCSFPENRVGNVQISEGRVIINSVPPLQNNGDQQQQ